MSSHASSAIPAMTIPRESKMPVYCVIIEYYYIPIPQTTYITPTGANQMQDCIEKSYTERDLQNTLLLQEMLHEGH